MNDVVAERCILFKNRYIPVKNIQSVKHFICTIKDEKLNINKYGVGLFIKDYGGTIIYEYYGDMQPAQNRLNKIRNFLREKDKNGD